MSQNRLEFISSWLVCSSLLIVSACGDSGGGDDPSDHSHKHDSGAADGGKSSTADRDGAISSDAAVDRDGDVVGTDGGGGGGHGGLDGGDVDASISGLPTVTFDPPGKGFGSSFDLELTSNDPAAVIHYTLNGKTPTAASAVYDGPIEIAATTLVRAFAQGETGNSPVFEQTYFELATDAKAFESNLPVVVIHMLAKPLPGSAPEDTSYVPAMMSVFEPSAGSTSLSDDPAFSSHLGIKVRGRSTRDNPKHNYTIELQDAAGEDNPHEMMGMPSESDWVLYAPYDFDRSLVRNAFVYQLANRLGHWAPHTRFCEVFIEAEGMPLTMTQSYVGVYVMTERIKRDVNRVPIVKIKSTDIAEPEVTGGYIFKRDALDPPYDDAQKFSTAGGNDLVYDYPKQNDIVPAQTTYLTSYVESVERALAANDGIDPITKSDYKDLIDVSSFIDAHIIGELTKNPDAFQLSEYFYKDRLGKMNAGPVWDFDLSMNAEDPFVDPDRAEDPTHWGPGTEDSLFRGSFYNALFTHADFEDAYWDRWTALLATNQPLTTTAWNNTLDGYETLLESAELRNRARWPDAAPTAGSKQLQDEISLIEVWLSQRRTWIVSQLGVTPN